jgi:hypothetical protein
LGVVVAGIDAMERLSGRGREEMERDLDFGRVRAMSEAGRGEGRSGEGMTRTERRTAMRAVQISEEAASMLKGG